MMRAVFGNKKESRGGSRVRVISICCPTRVCESRPDAMVTCFYTGGGARKAQFCRHHRSFSNG